MSGETDRVLARSGPSFRRSALSAGEVSAGRTLEVMQSVLVISLVSILAMLLLPYR